MPVDAERLWVRFLDGVRTTSTHCADLERARTDVDIEKALSAINTDARATTNAARDLTEWGRRKAGR